MSSENGKFLGFIAFVALVAVALLEALSVLPIKLDDVLDNIVNTIKNLCVCLVIAITAYRFVLNKSKGLKITYWICVGIYLLSTLFIWVF